MYGSCRIIRSSVILTALFKWSFGVIFREFKTVTGSIVTFGVEVELGVNLRQICERYYTVISIKITAGRRRPLAKTSAVAAVGWLCTRTGSGFVSKQEPIARRKQESRQYKVFYDPQSSGA